VRFDCCVAEAARQKLQANQSLALHDLPGRGRLARSQGGVAWKAERSREVVFPFRVALR
jgi:hypothetical protein